MTYAKKRVLWVKIFIYFSIIDGRFLILFFIVKSHVKEEEHKGNVSLYSRNRRRYL